MPKKRERDASEFYKAEIRELKKEIRQLRQQLRSYEKYEQQVQDSEIDTSTEDTVPKQVDPPCPTCGKGKLEFFELIGRIFERCTICDHQKRVK